MKLALHRGRDYKGKNSTLMLCKPLECTIIFQTGVMNSQLSELPVTEVRFWNVQYKLTKEVLNTGFLIYEKQIKYYRHFGKSGKYKKCHEENCLWHDIC